MQLYISTLLILALLWSGILVPVSAIIAQDTCAKNLDQAQTSYYEGKFDGAISLVKECIEQGGMDKTELARAYKILAQAYWAKNQLEAAGMIIGKLLDLQPEYNPSAADEPPKFIRLVEEIKAKRLSQLESNTEEDNKWLWIGAGSVAVIGVITIIALTNKGGDDKPKPLSEPPAWPSNQ